MMDSELRELLEQAKSREMSPEERAEQAINNAFANGAISDDRITRETIEATAKLMERSESPVQQEKVLA